MILVVIFWLSGALAFLVGVAIALSGDLSNGALLASAPFWGACIFFFGVAEIIHAVTRTAKASEDTARYLKQLAEKRDFS